jgi:hypothetical protein
MCTQIFIHFLTNSHPVFINEKNYLVLVYIIGHFLIIIDLIKMKSFDLMMISATQFFITSILDFLLKNLLLKKYKLIFILAFDVKGIGT